MHGSILKEEERLKGIAYDLKKVLSQEYKEVELIFSDEYSYNAILKEILTNEEIKFYAKTSSNDIIVIVAKDKNGNVVYEAQINNPICFVTLFKVI